MPEGTFFHGMAHTATEGLTWFPYMPIHINVLLANTLDATEFEIVLQELSLIKLRYLYKNVAVMSKGDFPKMFI